MILRKQAECHYNTPAEAEKWLAAAVSIIEAGDVPEDLRAAAFTAVYGSLSGKHVQMEMLSTAGVNGLSRVG